MRQIIFCLLLCLSCFLAFSARAAEVHDLNRGWRFSLSGTPSHHPAAPVDLPHTWNSDALGTHRTFVRGVGNYLRTLDVPASWRGRRIFLRFGAASTLCDLVVNGRHVGQHRGGYTAFTFEITDYLRPGEQNTLLTIVNNSPQPDILPTAGGRNAYGGLIRDVELIVTGPVALLPGSEVRVVSEKNTGDDFTLSATVHPIAPVEKQIDVEVALLDADGNPIVERRQRVRVGPKAPSTATLALPVAAPRRWNGRLDPYLYTLRVKLLEGEQAVDSIALQTGFREFAVDPARGFLLNGKPYPLRGVSMAHDRPLIGTALRPRHIARDIAIACEMGANFIITLPHSPAFYKECDRAGIVVMSQLPLLGATGFTERAFFDTPAFRQNGRDQLTEMIRQQSNHPCVMAWSLFDGLSMHGDDPTAYVKELNALAKKEAPSRLTACVSNQDGAINLVTDLILWKHTFGWTQGQPSDIAVWLDHLHRSWAQLRSGVAYGAGGNIDQQSDTLTRPDPDSHFHPENWQRYLHEQYYARLKDDPALWAIVAGELFDFASLEEGPLGIDNMGLVTIDRAERKEAFRFYRDAWNAPQLPQ